MKQQAVDIAKYFSFVRVAKINKKIFIPNFMNDLFVLPIKFLVLYIVWSAVFNIIGTDQINGFALWKMILYYFIYFTATQIAGYYRQLPYTVWNEITQGDLSKFVCRPISYIKYHFFYGLGYTYYSAIFCLPITIIASIYFFDGIAFLAKALLFGVCLTMGIFITFFVYIMIGLLSFWTKSVFGYRDMILHVGGIFAGGIIPLSFMPDLFQNISYFLPFRYMIYDPICILVYDYSFREVISVILRQGIYIVVLGVITQYMWKIGLKRYEAQGG